MQGGFLSFQCVSVCDLRQFGSCEIIGSVSLCPAFALSALSARCSCIHAAPLLSYPAYWQERAGGQSFGGRGVSHIIALRHAARCSERSPIHCLILSWLVVRTASRRRRPTQCRYLYQQRTHARISPQSVGNCR